MATRYYQMAQPRGFNHTEHCGTSGPVKPQFTLSALNSTDCADNKNQKLRCVMDGIGLSENNYGYSEYVIGMDYSSLPAGYSVNSISVKQDGVLVPDSSLVSLGDKKFGFWFSDNDGDLDTTSIVFEFSVSGESGESGISLKINFFARGDYDDPDSYTPLPVTPNSLTFTHISACNTVRGWLTAVSSTDCAPSSFDPNITYHLPFKIHLQLKDLDVNEFFKIAWSVFSKTYPNHVFTWTVTKMENSKETILYNGVKGASFSRKIKAESPNLDLYIYLEVTGGEDTITFNCSVINTSNNKTLILNKNTLSLSHQTCTTTNDSFQIERKGAESVCGMHPLYFQIQGKNLLVGATYGFDFPLVMNEGTAEGTTWVVYYNDKVLKSGTWTMADHRIKFQIIATSATDFVFIKLTAPSSSFSGIFTLDASDVHIVNSSLNGKTVPASGSYYGSFSGECLSTPRKVDFTVDNIICKNNCTSSLLDIKLATTIDCQFTVHVANFLKDHIYKVYSHNDSEGLFPSWLLYYGDTPIASRGENHGEFMWSYNSNTPTDLVLKTECFVILAFTSTATETFRISDVTGDPSNPPTTTKTLTFHLPAAWDCGGVN